MKLVKKSALFLLVIAFSVMILGNAKMIAMAETVITPIATNTDVIETIPDKGALYYSFTTAKSGYFTYSMNHTDIDETGSFYISLLDSEQTEIDYATGKNIGSNTWPCVPGMTYYFKVTNDSGSRNQQFKLRVNEIAEANWEQESNNTQETATVVALDIAEKGVISGSHDGEDWYKFAIAKAGYFEATLKHRDIAETGSYSLELFEKNGAKIAGECGKNIVLNRKSYNVGSVIYVKVKNDSGSRFQPYELKIGFVASDAYESEGNGDQATADPITFGKTYYGMIGEHNDAQDWFVFTNPKDATVTLTFGPNDVANKGNWSVRVVDEKGNEKSVYCDSVSKSVPMLLQKGKFYIKIVNDSGSREKLYAFNIARKDYAITGTTKIKSVKCKKGFLGIGIKQIKLTKIAKNATDYEVKISKSKKMKKPVVDTTAKAGKKLELSSGVNRGKYYVQVRPYVTDLFGNRWTGKKSNVLKFSAK